MSSDVYERLGKKLDELPNGFPSTASGVELKILQKVFTPEEAGWALKMDPVPQPVEVIAERFQKPISEMQAILDHMAAKGQIGAIKKGDRYFYRMMPFIIGIYEFQSERIDKELATLFEEYFPTLAKTLGGVKPAVMRVIPVKKKIDAELSVPRYDDLRAMVKKGRSFQILECICRKEKSLKGHPCAHTLETCLSWSDEEGAFDKDSRGRAISKEEVLALLDTAEEEGLVQSFYNIQNGPPYHVCMCCSCCCAFIRGLKDLNAQYLLGKSHYTASIDQETCSQCGVCAEERCPVEAIAETENGYQVALEKCIGCGLCTPTCPTDSITLIQRPDAEQYIPPLNPQEWNKQRLANRKRLERKSFH
jgi:ferredoxin